MKWEDGRGGAMLIPDKESKIKDWYIVKEYIKAGGKLEDVVDEEKNKLTLLGALICIAAGVKLINKMFDKPKDTSEIEK